MLKLLDDETGMVIALDYDADGFPVVRVEVPPGSYRDANGDPTVEILLDGHIVRPMFLESEDL
jgi:hypothetical protein